MTLALLVYLAGVITSLSAFLSIVFVSTAILYGVYVLGYLIANETNWENRGKFYKWPFVLLICCGLFKVFLPSEKTMWLMAGAYTTEKVVESTVGKQTLELVELKLQEEINKLKGQK
jgi:FtsH-binding integral membrane protein